MNIAQLIHTPEKLDKETLYDLRSLIATHPYYQPARILLLQNLYLLHDSSFDEELRRTAIYVTDRNTLFNMIEAAHYRMHKQVGSVQNSKTKDEDRTSSLIDTFLDSIPEDTAEPEEKKQRKPTPTDATVDYVSYLMELEEDADTSNASDKVMPITSKHPKPSNDDRTTSLINNFLEDGGFTLREEENLEYVPETEDYIQASTTKKDSNEKEVSTSNSKVDNITTIAQNSISESNVQTPIEEPAITIRTADEYIKNGQYETALQIIKQLNLNNSKKSVYFADQIRFLEKLVINDRNKKQ